MKGEKGRLATVKMIMKGLMASILLVILFLTCFQPLLSKAEEKWVGVDETVVKKHAREYGRDSSPPLINTDQGDLLLFLFLLAGTVGGFILGYCWRMLTSGKTTVLEEKKKDNG